MARNNDESRYDRILERIKNLRLPLLTLDRKWYLLFNGNKPKQIQETENELNEVIKSESRIKEEKQKLNTLKKKLVDQIVGNMNAAEGSIGFRKMEKSRDLIEEINDKLILLENDELDIPLKLREKNAELAMETMELFYDSIADDLEEIAKLEQWIKETRAEMKKKIELYDEKVEKTRHVTRYFNSLLGPDITGMYMNYISGIDDDDEYEE